MGSQSAGKTIVLVVEDDPLLRMAVINLIEDAGFDVLEADNADDAIGVLEHRSDVRIVFTDVDMPGSMNGMRLAIAVRGRWPPIEIIVTSGYRRFRAGQMPARGVFLPKPYSGDDVVAAITLMAGGTNPLIVGQKHDPVA